MCVHVCVYIQGFPNIGHGGVGGWGGRILLGGDFCTRWGEPEEGWFWWFEPFSKLKTAFYKFWTSVKSKLAWSVCQEYEIKTNMIQEQWLQLKVMWGGIDFWWWRRNENLVVVVGGDLLGGGEWANFFGAGRNSSHPPSRENPDIYIYIFVL